jgi:hypothetical protein
MVRRPTKYSKRQEAIQEAYFAAMHLRESRGKPQLMNARKEQFMDAGNKWNRARKVIEQGDVVRVSSMAIANLREGNAMCASLRKEIGGRVNALDAISHGRSERGLNPVVEVKYTTARLEVLECE